MGALLRQMSMARQSASFSSFERHLMRPRSPPSFRMLEQMRRGDDALLVDDTLVEGGLDVVDEVVVDVIHAQVGKLRLERRLDLVLGDEVEGGELHGDGERVARMALDNGLVRAYLAVNVATTLPDPTADESPDTSAIFPMRV